MVFGGPIDWTALDQQLYDDTSGLFDPVAESSRVRALRETSESRVSVICPTTDERCLFHTQLYDCFAAQTWPDVELIVVDTGVQPSPLLERQARLDPRVVYRHYQIPGAAWQVGLKRNIAVHVATGSIIVHFDDDDLYAPVYVERMVAAMGSAAAVTLSSWLVLDACTGYVVRVEPEPGGAQESWLLGYGFSHVYRRRACLAHPFPHVHFAEDYRFLLALQRAYGGAEAVRLYRDVEGIVLHVQHGGNLSNSHGRCEVAPALLWSMPVGQASGLGRLLCTSQGGLSPSCSGMESPFVSVGEAYNMYLRPSPHQGESDMRGALRSLGVRVLPGVALGANEAALISYRVWRCGELFVEPGRAFEAERRFDGQAAAGLPADVARITPPERVALLHVARSLLRRCPPRCSPAAECEGVVRLQLRQLSHIALVGLLAQMVWHFPRVRFEVAFDTGQAPEDDQALPEALRRELSLRLAAVR